jgi:hypothetical protein
MHWGTIFAVIAAVLSPVSAYIATQRATRRQLEDALDARLTAEASEHRQWLRDRRSDAYIELLHALADIRPVLEGDYSASSLNRLAAVRDSNLIAVKLRAYASEPVIRAFNELAPLLALFGEMGDGASKALSSDLLGTIKTIRDLIRDEFRSPGTDLVRAGNS